MPPVAADQAPPIDPTVVPRDWQVRQARGIEWLADYERRARRRTWTLAVCAGAGAYSLAGAGAWMIFR